jgi:Fic family protein
MESEIELESLFEFLNNDTEFHPILQSWILHFRIMSLPLYSESKSKFASLMQWFWLRKNKMDMHGLICLEHEIYINKLTYDQIINNAIQGEENALNEQITFGLQLQQMQLGRLKDLLRNYFRQQVDFDKLNPRQKNIMNYVFERGYKLKEIDDSILNKRQKLIMYIVQHRGFISTKELVNEFDCNRKTIQRDFQLLLDLGLVKSIGAGAGLRYCINLQEKGNPLMEKYQADFIQQKNTDEEFLEDEL